jgi:hypothetical protein
MMIFHHLNYRVIYNKAHCFQQIQLDPSACRPLTGFACKAPITGANIVEGISQVRGMHCILELQHHVPSQRKLQWTDGNMPVLESERKIIYKKIIPP